MNVFLDSDGVIADFERGAKDAGLLPAEFKFEPGAYLYLHRVPGADDAVARLKQLEDKGHLKVWVLTKPPKYSPYAYSEKVLWFSQYFPWLSNRIIVTHDKSVVGGPGDVLVDDRPHKGNAQCFRGKLIVFHTSNPT